MIKTDLDTFLKFIDQTGKQKHFWTIEIEELDWTRERKMRKEISETNDIFQVDFLPEKREIRINLPEEVWKNIDTIIMTKQFQEELIVEKQKEGEDKEGEHDQSAESLVRKLVRVIDDLCRQINQCGLDEQMWEVYKKAKEMLGDE